MCKYISGTPSLSPGTNEFEDVQAGRDYFEPMWLGLNKVNGSLIFPDVAKDLLLEYLSGKQIDPNTEYSHD